MTTEIQKELIQRLKEMEEITREYGYLPIGRASQFLHRASSILRSLEDMEKSRDKWREKYYELLKKHSS